MEVTDKEVTDKQPLVGNGRKYGKYIGNGVGRKVTLCILLSIVVILLILLIVYPFDGEDEASGETSDYKKYKFQWAPFTPALDDWTPDSVPTINYSAIPYLARTGDRFGAYYMFIGGSNAQFDTMTVEERKELIYTYVNTTIENDYDFYLIFQICSTKLFESVELATFAKELHEQYGKPDAIASLPTFYERPSVTDDYEQLMKWFRPIVDAAQGLPFWYYHLPGQTNVNLNMGDFIEVAWNGNDQGTFLRELKGAKYVSSSGSDIFRTTNEFSQDENGGDYGGFEMIVWSSPIAQFTGLQKLAGFGQDYVWIPVRKCILKAIENKQFDQAYEYEEWRRDMSGRMGSVVKRRCLHQRISGFHMGPPRQPDLPIHQSECDDLLNELDGVQFFDHLQQQITDCV